MGKSSDVFGISKIEIGDPGDGIPGVVLVEYNDIKEASATLKIPQSETVKIFSETRRGVPYRVLNAGSPDGPMFELEFLGLDIADWPLFLGGAEAAGKWTSPLTDVDIYKTVVLTTKPTDDAGTVLVFTMAYALLTSGFDGAITFNDLTPIKVKIEAMVPVSAIDVEGDALTVEEI